MSDKKKIKELYNFPVEIEKEVEETVVKKEGDEEIKVTKKVKKAVPYQVVIKHPSRREIEEAEMEYSIEMSRCIKAGIVTKGMLAKKYSDTGGVLAEEEAKNLTKLYAQIAEVELEIEKLSAKAKLTKKDKDLITEKFNQLAEYRKVVIEVESAYSSLFNHTADTKAQNKAILWFMLHISYYREGEGEELISLFEGSTFEEKKESYYKMEEDGHFIFDLVKSKLPALVSFWYFSENASPEEIGSFDKKMEEGEI